MSSSTTVLKKVTTKIGSGATPRGGGNSYLASGPVALIRSQNVRDDGFDTHGLAYISQEQANLLSNVEVFIDDVLLNITGDSVARVAKVPEYVLPARVNQHVSIIRADKVDLVPDYLYYYLKSPKVNNLLLSIASAGATRNALTKSQIENLVIDLPNIPTQCRVAKILNDLDKKIELNRTMNKTLEDMGQALFKQHFISNSGTDNKRILDVADVIDCLHSKKPERSIIDTGYVLLQLNNIVDKGILDLQDKFFVTKTDYEKWVSRIEVMENDFVITNVGRSGAVAKIPPKIYAAMGRNMTAIRLRKDFPYPGFFSFLLNSAFMQKQIESKLDSGTILSALNVRTIPNLIFPISTQKNLEDLEPLFSILRHTIEMNYRESFMLGQARDLLLPKLISGKITI